MMLQRLSLYLCLALAVLSGAAAAGTAGAPGNAQTPRLQKSQTNAFAAHSWLPPVPNTKPAPPPPPRAPPLPFVYLGRMQDGDAVCVFVSQGARTHVLRSGDSVAGYRVESISPTDVAFVYLALGEKQRLTFGSEN